MSSNTLSPADAIYLASKPIGLARRYGAIWLSKIRQRASNFKATLPTRRDLRECLRSRHILPRIDSNSSIYQEEDSSLDSSRRTSHRRDSFGLHPLASHPPFPPEVSELPIPSSLRSDTLRSQASASSVPILTKNRALYVTNPDPSSSSPRTSLQSIVSNAELAYELPADNISGSTLVNDVSTGNDSRATSLASRETETEDTAEFDIPEQLRAGDSRNDHTIPSLGQRWEHFQRTIGAAIHSHERGPAGRSIELFPSAGNEAQRRRGRQANRQERRERRRNRLSQEINEWIAELEQQQEQQRQEQERQAQQLELTKEVRFADLPQGLTDLPRADSPILGASVSVKREQRRQRRVDTPYPRTVDADAELYFGDYTNANAYTEVNQQLPSSPSSRERHAFIQDWVPIPAELEGNLSVISITTHPDRPTEDAAGYFDSPFPPPAACVSPATSASSEISITTTFPPRNPLQASSIFSDSDWEIEEGSASTTTTKMDLAADFADFADQASDRRFSRDLGLREEREARQRVYHRQQYERQLALLEAARETQAETTSMRAVTGEVSSMRTYLGAALDEDVGRVADDFRKECLRNFAKGL